MYKKVVSVLVSLIIVFSIVAIGDVNSEEKPLQKFLLSSIGLCRSAFLSWEKVPDSLTYIVKRDNIEVAKLSSEVNYYVDYDETLKEGTTHVYKVISVDANEEPIAESLSSKTENMCFSEDDCYKKLEYTIDSYMYKVDGEMFGPMDAPPQIIGGRTFLVIRYVTESIGAEIAWDGAERKVTITTKAGKVIDLWLGKSTAEIYGEKVEIDPNNSDVVPVIVNGRTLLPLRFVGEQLGADGENGIIWHPEEKRVEMNVFDETCIPPFEWRLTVVGVDSVMGTLVCENSFGIEFDLVMDTSFPIGVAEGSRVVVNGSVSQTRLGERPEITCSKIVIIDKPDQTDSYKCKIVSIECGDRDSTIVIKRDDGGEETLKVDGKSMCGLQTDTWVTIDIGEDGVVFDWDFIIDEIVEEESEEFGPEMVKILSVDFDQKIIRCNKPDDFYKDWRRAEEIQYRFRDELLVSEVEDHRCYNIWYTRNQLNKEFLTKIERIPCPPQFIIDYVNVPEAATSGMGNKIKIKITNHNEFPRIYEPIFRSDEFNGYFQPDNEEIEVYPGESGYFSMNFVSSFDFEGVMIFEVGAVCDGVEQIEEFEILFEKPQIEIEKIPYVVKIRKGKSDYFEFKIFNNGTEKIKVETYVEGYDFPGRVYISSDTCWVKPGIPKECKVRVEWDMDTPIGTQYPIEYGASIGDYTEKTNVMVQCISDLAPEIEGKFYYLGSNEVRFEGEIDWKGLEPLSLAFEWDDYVDWDEDRLIVWDDSYDDFPVTHKFNLVGHHIVLAKAEAKTGEVGFAWAWVELDGKYPVSYITDVIWRESEPRKFWLDGFINWNKLEKGNMAIYWDDDVVTYGLPCEYISKMISFIHIGSSITKATSGEQSYKNFGLIGFTPSVKSNPRFAINNDLNKNQSMQILKNVAYGRIMKREKVCYPGISFLSCVDDISSSIPIGRRTGGYHTE